MRMQNILKVLVYLWIAGLAGLSTHAADMKTCEHFCENCPTNAQQCTNNLCPLCLSKCAGPPSRPGSNGACAPAVGPTPQPITPSPAAVCIAACNAKNCSGCVNPTCTALGSSVTSNPGYVACSGCEAACNAKNCGGCVTPACTALGTYITSNPGYVACTACTNACAGAPSAAVCPGCTSTCQSNGISSTMTGAPAGLAPCVAYEASSGSCAAACANTPGSGASATQSSWIQCPVCASTCQKVNLPIPAPSNCSQSMQVCDAGCNGAASTDMTGQKCVSCLGNAACQGSGVAVSVNNDIPTVNVSGGTYVGACNTLFTNISQCAATIQNAGSNYSSCVSAIASAACTNWGLTQNNIANLIPNFSWLSQCSSAVASELATCQAACANSSNCSVCLASPCNGMPSITSSSAYQTCQTQLTTCQNNCANNSNCPGCLAAPCNGISSITSSPGYAACTNQFCDTNCENAFVDISGKSCYTGLNTQACLAALGGTPYNVVNITSSTTPNLLGCGTLYKNISTCVESCNVAAGQLQNYIQGSPSNYSVSQAINSCSTNGQCLANSTCKNLGLNNNTISSYISDWNQYTPFSNAGSQLSPCNNAIICQQNCTLAASSNSASTCQNNCFGSSACQALDITAAKSQNDTGVFGSCANIITQAAAQATQACISACSNGNCATCLSSSCNQIVNSNTTGYQSCQTQVSTCQNACNSNTTYDTTPGMSSVTCLTCLESSCVNLLTALNQSSYLSSCQNLMNNCWNYCYGTNPDPNQCSNLACSNFNGTPGYSR